MKQGAGIQDTGYYHVGSAFIFANIMTISIDNIVRHG